MVSPPRERPSPWSSVRGGAYVAEPLRITLLAQSPAGWARLCRLVSAAHAQADGSVPAVSWPVLREYADQDLVVLLGSSSTRSTVTTCPGYGWPGHVSDGEAPGRWVDRSASLDRF
ncbi:hypothetical protein [Streptomyces sp. NBC_00589]|uniref:hypothetical protein n=1 Tax=Streptomyces sp. NBC_00589 TaxID=2975785 RepID=UPI003FCC8790